MKPLSIEKDGKTYVLRFNGRPFMIREARDLRAFTLDVRDQDRQFYEQLMRAKEYRELTEGAKTATGFMDALEILVKNVMRRYSRGMR